MDFSASASYGFDCFRAQSLVFDHVIQADSYDPHFYSQSKRDRTEKCQTMIDNVSVCIVGAGKMGEALIRGLISKKAIAPSRLFAVDMLSDRCEYVSKKYGIVCDTDVTKFARNSNVIIIAVKPNDVGRVADKLRTLLTSKQLVITIVAGISSEFLSKILGGEIPVLRAMPNIAVIVGEGMIAISRGPNSSTEHIALAEEIFSSTGKVAIVDEKHLDAVTALSASGPAYIFTIIEALSDGGVTVGLERDISTLLATQTTLGAAKMILETREHPAKLRDMVTTPGGTTVEGLLELEKKKVRAALIEAVIKATEKSRAQLTK